MSHVFPLAANGEAALDPDVPAVRTRSEADALAAGLGTAVIALETEWMEVSEAEADAIVSRAESAVGRGFVQRYEDGSGHPVLAVTFWKTSDGVSEPDSGEPRAAGATSEPPREDHTDDLYFRGGRTQVRRMTRHADPRQLDLFAGPDQQGCEFRDPDNRDTVISEEEGDGTVIEGN